MKVEKLELKHLAPYLPYGLKVRYKEWPDEKPTKKATLTTISIKEIETTHRMRDGCCGDTIGWSGRNNVTDLELKLYLRPLSDLTKEITHGGETFVPMNELEQYNAPNWTDFKAHWCNLNSLNYTIIEYCIIDQLFEWHFDVFGLIPSDLALPKQ